ncbi:MAG TPA: hypothetical protein VNH44_12225 [Micropepsaceae bacterium]|nr:hypothetical protein [Micropepsaceae bacterium]
MTQPREFRIQRLGLRAWLTLIGVLIIAVAILFAITAVAIGVLLFLLPVFAVSALLYYLFPPKFRADPQNKRKDTSIIDGEYRVVDTAEIGREPPEERP